MSEPGARSGRLVEVSGALLLGGASSRMGRDKAHLPFEGRPLAVRAASLLDSLFEEVLLVGGEPPADAPGRRIADGPGPRCPLRGVVAALEATRAERVLLLATDLPRVPPELLLGLLAWPPADAVVPRAEGRLQPLCALYRREPALAEARRRLADGRLRLLDWLEALAPSVIEGADLAVLDPSGQALANVNTPEDVTRLATP